ncbi:hypothetical protein [Streptomyces sp. NPDC001020]
MGKKKTKKRWRDDWTLPPKAAVQKARLAETRRRLTDVRQPVPQRRLILALFALGVVTACGTLFFRLPSQTLVNDLRSRGVSVWAEVTSSPRDKYGNAGNVKVRFNGPKGEIETSLDDWGGRRPEGLVPGTAVSVTYDPRDPARVLTTEWVKNPPVMTFPMLVSLALSLVMLAGAAFLTIRRRALLKARSRLEAA